jgi:hypothetical protein
MADIGDYVWTELLQQERLKDTRPNSIGVVHIIARVTPSESPGGNDAEEYIAQCGYETQSWYFVGSMSPSHVSSELPKEDIPRCSICFAEKQ